MTKTPLQALQEKRDLIVQYGADASISLIDTKTMKRPASERIGRFLDEADEKKALSEGDIKKLRLEDRLRPFPMSEKS